MKSEEKSIQAISAQAHSEAADNRLLRKKLQARDKRVVELEAMVSNLNKQLCEKVDQLNDMMQKLVAFMTGNGEVNLSDSLREAVVAGVRAEFEAREQKLKETYASELEKITSDFNARLAAKQNEINQLKGINDGENPTTTMPSNSNSDSTMSPEAQLKASEQQKANLQVTAYGQHTESGKYHHGSQQTENADDLDHNGEDVPEEKIVTIAKTLKEHKDMKGVKKPRREQPLIDAAVGSKNDIVLKPTNLPADAVEIGEDVSVRHTYVKGFIRTYIIRRKKYKDSKGKCYHVNLPKEYKNCMGRTWATESLIAQILTMHFYYHMTIGDIEAWLKGMGLNYAHATIVGWIEIGAKEGINAPFNQHPHAKTMLFTPLSSMSGVTGSMGPFFCEFTLNGDIRPHDYPAIYAHEFAHLLGIANEGEANFYSYIVCTASSDKAVKFSGYYHIFFHVLRNVFDILGEKEGEKYLKYIRPEIIQLAKSDRSYWLSKRCKMLDTAQDFIFDLYLRGNHVAEGRKSYSGVVGLILAWESHHTK